MFSLESQIKQLLKVIFVERYAAKTFETPSEKLCKITRGAKHEPRLDKTQVERARYHGYKFSCRLSFHFQGLSNISLK